MNKKNISKLVGDKGFTIIELIVVIAIIAVLAAIVLVNVTQYINKSKNAAITGNMSTLLINAAAYFEGDSTRTGNGFASDATVGCGAAGPIALAVKAANGGTSGTVPTCFGNGTQRWCGSAKMLSGGTFTNFCVDSTGYKGELGATNSCSSTNFCCASSCP